MPAPLKRPRVYYRMLGTTQVVGRRRGPLGRLSASSKALGVLAFLALNTRNGPCARDRILPYFWPDATTRRARHRLRQTLRRLRMMLGPGVVRSRGHQDLWLSSDAFGADVLDLMAALDDGRIAEAYHLYRGDLLPGFDLEDASPEFEGWLWSVRREVRKRLTEALWEESREAGEAGDIGAELRWAQRALFLDPYNERSVAGLLASLRDAGYPADAVRLYEEYREALRRDLDLEPGEEISAEAARCRSAAADPSGQANNGTGRSRVRGAQAESLTGCLRTRPKSRSWLAWAAWRRGSAFG
jgi:DNA-binding SARP family transcriptional activator